MRAYRSLLLALVTTSALLAGGCQQTVGQQPVAVSQGDQVAAGGEVAADGGSDAQAAVPVAIADDDFGNLAAIGPTTPVYDRHTLAERREKGLTTELPPLELYYAPNGGRTVYLTFDDGPDDKNTPAILDILEQEGVSATFYVLGKHAELYPDIIRRIYEGGHAIGNHSYDHDYSRLYASPDAFLAEMEQTDEILKEIIGVRPLILRAPSGAMSSFTPDYPPALAANGYVEHDWNISSADAAPNHPVAQDFIDNISYQITNPAVADSAIILMHSSEGHEETVKALPEIIALLKEAGYAFGVITPRTPPPW